MSHQAADHPQSHHRCGRGSGTQGRSIRRRRSSLWIRWRAQARLALDRRMLQEVYEALETRDVVLVLMDATRKVLLETAAEPAVAARGRGRIPGPRIRTWAPVVSQAPKHERTNWASEDGVSLRPHPQARLPGLPSADQRSTWFQGPSATADRYAPPPVQLRPDHSGERRQARRPRSAGAQNRRGAATGERYYPRISTLTSPSASWWPN